MRWVVCTFLLGVVACSYASPADAAKNVIRRYFPTVADYFRFENLVGARPLAYEYEAVDGRVTVRGGSGVAMCRGAYDYLRKACGAQVTWSGTSFHAPKRLPDAPRTRVESPYRWVLQDNVCTFGYTTAFYQWPQWQRYLDIMALHGVNLEFAPVGGEAIWKRVWDGFGLDTKDFFTGPAFLPWQRMGNVNKHDGPLPESYLRKSVALQKRILAHMRVLGIEPVAPAFAGFVPAGFAAKYPNERVVRIGSWAGFEGPYRTQILHPLSPMYAKIGRAYIEAWTKEFGKADYYLADSFNELEVPVPPERDKRLEELAEFGRSVYDGIRSGDPQGTWVMQGWLFSNAASFWDEDSVKALLSRVPDDRMLILDLWAEVAPVWKRQHAFYGKPWIASTITTWGGNNQIAGNFETYAKLSADTLAAPNHGKLVGYGMSFEGSESNEPEYELMCDSAWSPRRIDLKTWIPAMVRDRYGEADPRAVEAWRLFERSVYHTGTGGHLLLQERPRDLSPLSRGAWVQDSDDFKKGVELLVSARDKLGSNPLYEADVLQFTAQWTLLEADKNLRDAVLAAQEGETQESLRYEARFRKLAHLADAQLADHPLDNLKRWVSMARSWGTTTEEKGYYESDAKRQVTVWGGPILSEYAAKLWSGLIGGYYLPRWTQWLEQKRQGKGWDPRPWEEQWITTPRSEPSAFAAANDEWPSTLVKGLRREDQIRYADRLIGTIVGGWKSGEASEAWAVREWDATKALTSTGDVEVRFQYTSGPHRLEVDGVELLADGVVVARDAHQGRTGTEDVDNVYRLKLLEFRAGSKYVLRAKVRSDGGNDSNGTIYLRLKPLHNQNRP